MCPAANYLKVMRERKLAFEGLEEEIEVTGVATCGGCPGKKAVTRAAMMVKQGAEAIAMASCITKGNPIGFACPHKEQMQAAISAKAGQNVKFFDYTH